jgi:hypothetical protein
MSVVNLRKKLDERGLDVDGTHEMLVDSLERSYPCFIVEGAGSACVNGRYIAAANKGEMVVYRTISKDEGVVVLLIEGTNYWDISIKDLHQKTDKILYQTLYRVHSKESQGPPSNGWKTMTKHGAVDPPPTVITKFPW